MTREAALYIDSVANGTVPASDSVEAKAYKAWSEESGTVTGTWAEFQLMRILSKVRLEETFV